MFYRPSQEPPYFDRYFCNDSLLSSPSQGERGIRHPPLSTTVNHLESSPHRQGSTVQFSDSRNQIQLSSPALASTSKNEADAAAGGGFNRVSSFHLLKRATSSDTLPRPVSGIAINKLGSILSPRIPNDEINSLSVFSDLRRIQQQQNQSNNPEYSSTDTKIKPDWRLRDKMKTVGVGLILALNIGTDPPDVVKPNPCAVLQCWIDPRPTVVGMTRTKAKELIGERLEAQYAKWQLARASRPLQYRKALDPTVEDVRNLCMRLRSQARTERILIHYNGHGVPRPTEQGDIWVFDKNHTKYISLNVHDLRQWMGKPSIVVLDCSNAGILIPFWTSPEQITSSSSPASFDQQQHRGAASQNAEISNDANVDDNDYATESTSSWVRDTIILCPCSEGEWLPMHPDYPADIFTSCLTTPIPIALRWFIRQNNSMAFGSLNPDAVDLIPGKANDRKTPLGELNWIFTAVTDSIAWNVLPKPLFQRLFRQDLLVASMFRNFLLADRILRSFGCTPVSFPPLPGSSAGNSSYTTRDSLMADHPLWHAWDLACETMLYQLMNDGVLSNPNPSHPLIPSIDSAQQQHDWDSENNKSSMRSTNPGITPPQENQQQYSTASLSSPFFSEQLTAFEIWLELANVRKLQAMKATGNDFSCYSLESPEQLPVVLQVLLTQVHRVRALQLLQRFLDLGPWAVNLSLSLGIFPYVMKLLQSPEYKSLLVSIWASIIAFDPSCRVDLLKDSAVHHFVHHLWYGLRTTNVGQVNSTHNMEETLDISQAANERTLAAFVLAAICFEYPAGQAECLRLNLHTNCCALLTMYEQAKQQKLSGNEPMESESHTKSVSDQSNTTLDSHFPAHFRLWLCICLANIVKGNTPVQNELFNGGAHLRLKARLDDQNPDVRAAACYALGCLIGSESKKSSQLISAQDISTPHISSQPQLVVPQNQLLSTTPGSSSFLLNQRLPGGNAPSLIVPGGMPVGMAPVPGQLHPSFTLSPAVDAGGTVVSVTHLQPSGRTNTQMGANMSPGHPMLLQQLHHAPQQPVHPQFWSQSQQHSHQIAQRQHQQSGHTAAYILHSQKQQQMPSHNAVSGVHQYPHQILPGGFLMPQGNSIPLVLHQQPTMLGIPLNPTPFSYHQQHHHQFSTGPKVDQNQRMNPKPTIFEDKARLELDLSCLEVLLDLSVHDGSVVVRYEATVALGCAVGKYLEAFVIVAEELSSVVSSHVESHRKPLLTPPRGLNQQYQDRFMAIWKSVRTLQRIDPFPPISKSANTIVSFVHDTLLRFRMEGAKKLEEMQARTRQRVNLLSGINEDGSSDVLSDGNNVVNITNRSISTILDSDHITDLRRVASECAKSENSLSGSMEAISHRKVSTPTKTLDDDSSTAYTLPTSEFYAWKMDVFDSKFSLSEDDEHSDPDPLSPSGAAKAYQERRNFVVRENGTKLLHRYESLTPKPPEPKRKGIQLILEDEDESAELAAEQDASDKKAELELQEKKLFHNEGVARTALINFHPFEDYVMACSATDVITLWDTLTGENHTKFKNGNPKGSRMTSSFWINEETSSRFIVGSDDGSVKIWSNILETNGECKKSPPRLFSAFYAAPMEVGLGDSGLILDWQSYSGNLLAGGNSKFICCWDLEAEKISCKIDTNNDSYVSTLTTAWDYDTLGDDSSFKNYSGIGSNIIVAGHSDGSIRIFDLRANRIANELQGEQQGATGRRQRQRATTYKEHNSYVVNTSFRTYSNRFELISGTLTGEIKAWDLRMSTSVRTVVVQRSIMTAMSVHHKIPIMATGSHAQFIKILTLDGDTMQVIRYHEKIASHRIGKVSCLAFHPNKPLLAAGATDSYIGLYTTKKQNY